jgi:hypothetical protein
MPGHVDSTLLVLLILAGTDHTNSLVSAHAPRAGRSLPYVVATLSAFTEPIATAPTKPVLLNLRAALVERPLRFHDRHQFFISPSGSRARDSDRSPSPQYDHPS